VKKEFIAPKKKRQFYRAKKKKENFPRKTFFVTLLLELRTLLDQDQVESPVVDA